MKESSGGALEEKGRSASDKEKTKLRERQRRSITTKIFNGLRKHGGYTLLPRADINDVLRELAKEAGWVVEPDGTTYRSKESRHQSPSPCAGYAGKSSSTTTPTSSFGGAGDCSTTGSPVAIHHPSPSSSEAAVGSTFRYLQGTSSSRNLTDERELSLSLTSDDVTAYVMGGVQFRGLGYGGLGGPQASTAVMLPHQQHLLFQEDRVSNQSTPVGSPQHHA